MNPFSTDGRFSDTFFGFFFVKLIARHTVNKLTQIFIVGLSIVSVSFCIYSPLGLIQVDRRRRRVLDEVLVTWTVSFGELYGFSSFHLADPVSEHFCASAIASPSSLTQLQI